MVCISGLPGAGTTTLSRHVAGRLGWEHLYAGAVFRALAAERGLTLADLGVYAVEHPEVDRELDERLTGRARAGHCVWEGRLAGWLSQRGGVAALRVWIGCDETERARRVAAREGADLADALAENRAREATERTRWATIYGVDIRDLSVYDLVLDSTAVPPAALADRVVAALGW